MSESHENRQESFKEGNKRIGLSACTGDGPSLNDENVSSSERALRKSERGSERGVEKEGERRRKAGKMMRRRRMSGDCISPMGEMKEGEAIQIH